MAWLCQTEFVHAQLLLLQCQRGAEGEGGGLGSLLLPLMIIVAIFWFLVFRPEHRQRKELQRKIESLEKGQKVVTRGGIIGEVTRVDDREIVVRVDKDKDVRLHFAKSAVADIVSPEGSASESTAAKP